MDGNLGSRRERKKQAARQKILYETIELINQHGVTGTRIETICQQAGLTRRTFYSHFASKDALIMAICEASILRRTGLIVDQAIADHESLEARIHFVFDELKSRFDSGNPMLRELIGFLVTKLSANSDGAREQLHYMQDSFRRLYQASQPEIDSAVDEDFFADMTVGMIQAVLINWLYRDDYDLPAAYGALEEAVLKVLRPAAIR